jgi:murein DD-endopeptidase MepM/ murein hydrolase activator NlpD
MPHSRVVSFPPPLASPSRLSGLVAGILLVVLPGSSSTGPPIWQPSVERSEVERSEAGTARPVEVEGRWEWPVAPPHPIVRAFEAPETRYTAGHRGIDIAAEAGRPVLAPADGVVHFSGIVVDRPLVSIRVGADVIASVEPVESSVVDGDTVTRGQVIGTVGGGGHCDGRCVHLGVRLHGDYVSPMLYLGGIPLPVLLPTRGT